MKYNFPIEKNPNPKEKPNPDTLRFGTEFTDHMFIMDYEEDVYKRQVPGKVGITTLGFASFTKGADVFLSSHTGLSTLVSSFLPANSLVLTGNTSSRGSCHFEMSPSRSSAVTFPSESLIDNTLSSVVLPKIA